MEDDEAILELQLGPDSVVAADGEVDRWDQIEEDLRQQQHEDAARRAAERGGSQGSGHNEEDGEAASANGSDASEDDEAELGMHAVAAPTEGADEFSDEQLLAVAHKKEAKTLGKALYKRWKALHKHSHGGSKHGDKKKKKSKKEKSASAKKSSGSKKKKSESSSAGSQKKKRRTRTAVSAGADDVPFMSEEEVNRLLSNDTATSGTLGVDAARRTAAGSALARRAGGLGDTKKRLSAAEERAMNERIAGDLVAEMKRAARDDEDALKHPERGAPPLSRIALCDKVNSLCRRQCLYGPLIEAGVLQELSQWLYSLSRNEPAPFELRATALDVLLNFPIVGEVRPKLSKKNADGERVSEDLTEFRGIDWDDLRNTDLGVAVNSLRQHANEIPAHRSKCIRLLERLSRARHHDDNDVDEHSSGGPAQVYWRTKGDPTVASPFVTVQTGSEAFQKAIMKPDPRDPTSYNNYLPWRPAAVTVTNLSGDLLRAAQERFATKQEVADNKRA